MDNDKTDYSKVPMGLTMALAQNIDAMKKFVSMDDSAKESVIRMTHTINSKQQMRSFVDNNFTITEPFCKTENEDVGNLPEL